MNKREVVIGLGTAGIMMTEIFTSCGPSNNTPNLTEGSSPNPSPLSSPTIEQSPTVPPSPISTATLWPMGGVDYSRVPDPTVRAILEGKRYTEPTIVALNPYLEKLRNDEATAQAKPTEKPAPPTQETVKRVENLLPEEAIYSGTMTSKEGKTGSFIVAHLPGEQYNDKVYVFASVDGNFASFLYQVDDIQANTVNTSTSKGRRHANFTVVNGQLTGGADNLMGGTAWKITGSYNGAGEAIFYQGAQKMYATNSPKINNPNLWANVPRDTINYFAFELTIAPSGERTPIKPPFNK